MCSEVVMGDAMKPSTVRHAPAERPQPRSRTEIEREILHLTEAREAGLVTEDEFRERKLHLLGRAL